MNIIQAIEQMEAQMRDMAPMFWTYKQALKAQGFTENQAYQMTRDYQNIILSNAKGGN